MIFVSLSVFIFNHFYLLNYENAAPTMLTAPALYDPSFSIETQDEKFFFIIDLFDFISHL